MANKSCDHLEQVRSVPPRTQGCEECLALGDRWVHLRECMTCGHVGCCDSSKNKHATRHFHATEHPIIRSIEPGEEWGWCYPDELTLSFSGPRPAVARVGGPWRQPNARSWSRSTEA